MADFDAVSKFATTLPSASNEEKLEMYALFKQAKQDPPIDQVKRPGMMDFTGKAKYDAWKKKADAGLTPEDAKEQYIAYVKKLAEEKGVAFNP